MTRRITQRQLCNGSGEIMRALAQGERFVVTRDGAAVGELMPLRRRRFVATPVAAATFRGASRVDIERLRGDLCAVVEPSHR